MLRKDFSKINLDLNILNDNPDIHSKELDGFKIQNAYFQNPNHSKHFLSGYPPFLRGITKTMYLDTPWENLQIVEVQELLEKSEHEIESVFKNQSLQDLVFRIKFNLHFQNQCKSILSILQKLDIPKDKVKIRIDCNDFQELKSDFIQECFSFIKQQLSLQYTFLFVINNGKDICLALSQGLYKIYQFVQTTTHHDWKIENILPKIVLQFSFQSNVWVEVSKLRAARVLWTKLMTDSNPKSPNHLALNIHYKIQSSNELTQKTIQSFIAVLGGAQAINYDFKFNQEENQILQSILSNDLKLTRTVDPLGGSHIIENMTAQIIYKTWDYLEQYKNKN